MLDILRNRKNPTVRSLNELVVDSKKLLDNLQLLHEIHPHDALFPVLKSNAYGHGIKEISSILAKATIPYICVDSFPEYQLVKKYSSSKALILGETFPENYKHYDPAHATLCVYNSETIKHLIKSKKKRSIHLFLNTGMNREGIPMHQLSYILELLKDQKYLVVEGVLAHYANADENDSSFNQHQNEQFESMVRIIKKEGFSPTRIYHGNSAGIAKEHTDYFNARRVGLSMYGYSPMSEDDASGGMYTGLKPVLGVYSHVIGVQQLKKGEGTSYGMKRSASKPTSLAILPFGYAEGLSRQLTGKNRLVKIHDTYYPIVGTICMNLCSVHIGDDIISPGDRVEIVSSEPDAQNSLSEMAKMCNTIVYELLVKFPMNMKRTVV